MTDSRRQVFTAERQALSRREEAHKKADPTGFAVAEMNRRVAETVAASMADTLPSVLQQHLPGMVRSQVEDALAQTLPKVLEPVVQSVVETTMVQLLPDMLEDVLARHKPAHPEPAPVPEAEPERDYMSMIKLELVELLERIHSTREEIAKLRPAEGECDQIVTATAELESVVKATESATTDILEGAEKLEGLAARLRESGRPTKKMLAEVADEIDACTQGILMTCSFQDITGQRINAAINTLLYVEQSLGRVVDLWEITQGTGHAHLMRNAPDDNRPDKDLLHGPQQEGQGVSQADIDALFP